MDRVLIVEDEEAILLALEDDLRAEGYEVASATDGPAGLSMAEKNAYELIILDIMLPGMNGFEVCKRLRQASVTTPILILTAKSQEIDKVLGLELGADDYVTKPFSRRELLARVKAILRRGADPRPEMEPHCFGDVEVDFNKYEARKGGHAVHLTRLEYALLRFLIEHRDGVVSRFEILDQVWGDAASVYPRTVDTHIGRLRKKLEDDPENPRYIVGVRGVGYRFSG
ncbi:MAG: response regulator transcription factor [Longimicrobiales bacterium]|nr:response regulator transcription factor [Longimicrobiales bacterium]